MRICRSDIYNSSPQTGKIISCLFSHEFCCNLQDFVGNLPQFLGHFSSLWEFTVVYCCSLKTSPRYRFHMVWFKCRTSCGDREWHCLFHITGNDVLLHAHWSLKSAGQSGTLFRSYRSRIIREKEKWTFSTKKIWVNQGRKLEGIIKKKIKKKCHNKYYTHYWEKEWPHIFPVFYKSQLCPISQVADEQILQLADCILVSWAVQHHLIQTNFTKYKEDNRLLKPPCLQYKAGLRLRT